MGRTPIVPQSHLIGNWKDDVKGLVKGLKAPKVLEFVAIFFPISWLFANIAETKRVLVSLRGLHSLELKIENFSHYPFM